MKASSTRTSGDGTARRASSSPSPLASGNVDRVLDVLRKVGPVAEVAAAAHHRQVDAGAAAVDLDREDVGVLRRHAGVVLDRLLVQHARQRADLVADLGRLLELQRLGARHHLRLQRVHQLLLLALAGSARRWRRRARSRRARCSRRTGPSSA